MKNTKIILSSVVLITFLLQPLFCYEDDYKNQSTKKDFTQPFYLEPITDSIIGSTSVALAGSAFLCDKVFDIKQNNYNDYAHFPLDPNSLNSFDRAFINPYNKNLDYVGDSLLALSFALPTVMFSSKNTDWITIGTMYAETVLLAYGIKQWSKLLINRPRPYMYFPDFPANEVTEGDWNCSFPSGHTTLSFSAAAFTSAVFSSYFPSSPWRHVVTTSSFALATTVGIMRMCSGNHFATDVLTGALIGTICGFSVPFFHSNIFRNLVGLNNKTDIAISPLGFSVKIKI